MCLIHKMNIGKGIGNFMLHVLIKLNFNSCNTFPYLNKHVNQMLNYIYSTNSINHFKRLNVNIFPKCDRLLLMYRNLSKHSGFLSAFLRLASSIV